MSPRLFWKLFLIYAAFQLATVVVFVLLMANWLGTRALREEGQRLRDVSTMMRSLMQDSWAMAGTMEVQELVGDLNEATHLRLTLLDVDGSVLADSDFEPAEMENHKDRSELVEAARDGQGSSQRFSPSMHVEMLYFALRVDDVAGKPIGFVRAAVPLSEVEAEVSLARRVLWLMGLAVSVLGLTIPYFLVKRALQPVGRLTGAVNAMAEGRYNQRVSVSGRDELGLLAQSFNRMGSEIEARENQLLDAADRMAAVLGGMIEGVIAFDDQRRILFANEAAGTLLDFHPAEVEGQHMRDAIDNSMFKRVVKDLLGETDMPAEQLHALEVSANESVLAINAARLPGVPCPGIVLVMHDVTELRRLETLRQEFVANVSHELKTPLSSILAYAETLRRGALDDEDNRQRFVAQIEKQAKRLKELIQDMLSIARIESGQSPYETTAVNIAEFVGACLMEHEKAAHAKGIALVAQRDRDDIAVQADEEAIRQILDNLVTNAIKYTGEGGVVRVDWKSDGDGVILEVADNGIGIPEIHQSRIFERFYRVDKARSRELGGTGLGLSIVKHLAQMLGGSVSLESRPGKGSVFRVHLKAAWEGRYVETEGEKAS